MTGRFITVILLAGVFVFATSLKEPNFSYTISGDIQGLNNDSVIVFIQRSASVREVSGLDTIFCKANNNSFFIKANADGEKLASGRLGGMNSRKSFTFFIEKGSIRVKGNIDSTDGIRSTGTPDNNLYSDQNASEEKIYDQVRILQQRLNKQDTSDKQAYNRLSDQIGGLRDSIKNIRIQFVKKYPNSLASGIFIYVLTDRIPLAQLESLYNALGDNVKNSGHGMIVKRAIEGKRRTAIGRQAPEFSSPDTSGRSVSLSSFRGKYVLLDFWASWCVPCREESPYLLAAYNKYKDKGFTIISVSMDNDPAKWKSAILKDGLNWTHLSDLKALENVVAKLYGVQPIPDNFLMDPNGKIIARGLRGDEVERELSGVLK